MSNTILPFQPDAMSPAQLAAVSYLARYSGHTHKLYAYQLRRWFAWCETNRLDPLVEVQRAHVELYIRQLGETGLRPSSVNTMMHGVRGFFRFAHIDGLIPADPAIYARLPKIHQDESRTQGLDRLELIRFLQVAQTITVHHGALAYLLGINALRASEAAAVRIEDYRETLRGHRVLRLVGKGNKPATMPLTVPELRVLEACRGQRIDGPLVRRPMSGKPIDRRDCYRMVARIAKTAEIPRHISPHSLRHAAITNALDAGVPLRDAQILARHADPRTTEHYDRARGNLDRHGVHFLTAYVAGVQMARRCGRHPRVRSALLAPRKGYESDWWRDDIPRQRLEMRMFTQAGAGAAREPRLIGSCCYQFMQQTRLTPILNRCANALHDICSNERLPDHLDRLALRLCP